MLTAAFIIVAVILFGLAAFGVDAPRNRLVPAGLAFFAASFITPFV